MVLSWCRFWHSWVGPMVTMGGITAWYLFLRAFSCCLELIQRGFMVFFFLFFFFFHSCLFLFFSTTMIPRFASFLFSENWRGRKSVCLGLWEPGWRTAGVVRTCTQKRKGVVITSLD
ncbi:hypothetical protein QBC43DRAFT_120043 [Cladorrhinum sp. PSN259]|nr:hypothetical protein QBC43DRAFT_120043 [Cladorrhinum sp. PSN259]